jgi:hypothetical protein
LTKKITAPYIPKVKNLDSLLQAAKKSPKTILRILEAEEKNQPQPKPRGSKAPAGWDEDF